MASKKKVDSESDEFSSSDERVESSHVAETPPMSAVAAEAAAVRRERGRMRQVRPALGLSPTWRLKTKAGDEKPSKYLDVVFSAC